MAVPKRKVSKSRKAKRSANKHKPLPQLSVDTKTGSRHLRHRVDQQTGFYRGRQILSKQI